jgi:hypothetical protein
MSVYIIKNAQGNNFGKENLLRPGLLSQATGPRIDKPGPAPSSSMADPVKPAEFCPLS